MGLIVNQTAGGGGGGGGVASADRTGGSWSPVYLGSSSSASRLLPAPLFIITTGVRPKRSINWQPCMRTCYTKYQSLIKTFVYRVYRVRTYLKILKVA